MKKFQILLLALLLTGCNLVEQFLGQHDSIPQYSGEYEKTSESQMDGTLWELKLDTYQGNEHIYPDQSDDYYDLDDDGLLEIITTSHYLFFKDGKTSTYQLNTHEELAIQPEINESIYIAKVYNDTINNLYMVYDHEPVDYDVKNGIVYITVDEEEEYCYRNGDTLYGVYEDGGLEDMSTYTLSSQYTAEYLLDI